MATVVEEAHDASCLMKKWVNGPCTLEEMVKAMRVICMIQHDVLQALEVDNPR